MTLAADEAALPVPVRERGYAADTDPTAFWIAALAEATPELQWPFYLDVVDNMRKQDAQVGSVLRAVKSPILRTGWRIKPNGARDEVVAQCAGDFGLPIVGAGDDIPLPRGRRRRRFAFGEHLRLALLFQEFGHSVFEQVYYPPELEDGRYKAHLRKLGYRPPKTIARINVARDGGLVSIEQLASSGIGAGITLPVSRLVAYSHEREGGNWLGQSLLRTCFKNWLLKDRLLRVGTQTIERNGMGIPHYTAGTADEAEVNKGQELMSEVRAGDDSGISGPKDSKFDLVGVSGTLPDSLPHVKYHDEQIARAVLAHFLNLGTQTGSWALGDTFQDFFTLSLTAEAVMVRDTFQEHVLEDLVDINYGPDEPAPMLVFDEIGARSEAIVNAIAVLVNAQVLRADENLEAFVRTALGLPPYDETAAIERPMPAGQGAAA